MVGANPLWRIVSRNGLLISISTSVAPYGQRNLRSPASIARGDDDWFRARSEFFAPEQGTPDQNYWCSGQILENETMKFAIALVAAAGLALAIPAANAEETHVGVGVGPV